MLWNGWNTQSSYISLCIKIIFRRTLLSYEIQNEFLSSPQPLKTKRAFIFISFCEIIIYHFLSQTFSCTSLCSHSISWLIFSSIIVYILICLYVLFEFMMYLTKEKSFLVLETYGKSSYRTWRKICNCHFTKPA